MNLKTYKKNSDYNSIRYDLVNKLNKLCKKLDELFEINCGGCCYVAYCIAKLLEQFEINFKLVVFDNYYNLKDFTCLCELPVAMNHFAITIDDVIDGDVINCDDEYFNYYSYNSYDVNSDEILKFYNEHNNWNRRYNPDNNNTIMITINNFYYEWTKNLCKE